MADPNQTPARGNWRCPCNGCKKARIQALEEVLAIVDGGGDAYSRLSSIKELIEKEKPKKK